jgi:LytS/YehU family sensor histidine kinase
VVIPLRYFNRAVWLKPPIQLALFVLVSCFIAACTWSYVDNQIYSSWVKTWEHKNIMDYFVSVMSSFYLLLCWSGLYFGIKYYQRLQAQTEQTLRANAAAQSAQLKMLRYQLNPHFLFNTLNAISTLILDRANETANQTVLRLSDFLRYTLDKDPQSQVTLRSELDALDMFLDIEKVRFGERLRVHREIDASALDALVPSLILQPLIENAVKYAVTPREAGGTLHLSVQVLGGALVMSIADDGLGVDSSLATQSSGRGVGLKNTRERLRHLYGDNQAFTLAPNEPQGLVATINIPCAFEADTSDDHA